MSSDCNGVIQSNIEPKVLVPFRGFSVFRRLRTATLSSALQHPSLSPLPRIQCLPTIRKVAVEAGVPLRTS